MYIVMKDSLYREVLSRARADLAKALAERNRLREKMDEKETEIAQLQRLIGGIHAYVDESENSVNLLQSGEGLKTAVCTALRAAGGDVTVSDIFSILKELQFPIETHQNPLGSIYTTVTRLVAAEEVFPGEPCEGKKTYRWTRNPAALRQQVASTTVLAVLAANEANKKH